MPGVLQTGMFGDELAGLPVRLNIKSLVWYRNDVFAEQGYEVPGTWEEMVALTDEIRGDLGGQGTAPWCVGIESATATGWALTDWIEDAMLRLHGGEVYDRWVGHDLDFDSPEVRAAFKKVADIWFAEGNVVGSRQDIVATSVSTAPAPMFTDPPAAGYTARPASSRDRPPRRPSTAATTTSSTCRRSRTAPVTTRC